MFYRWCAMKTLFESFIEMAERLPPKAVKEALDRESKMVESDLIHDRVLSWMDGFSIMIFHRFIEAVKVHDKLIAVVLPPEHVAAYRELVKKLVRAGELPYNALRDFDDAFWGSQETMAGQPA